MDNLEISADEISSSGAKLIDSALIFAATKHQGIYRKLGRQPYIFHPIEVMSLCSMITEDPDVLAACLLHDLVEDADVSLDEIRAEFGERVADIVGHESENKREGQDPSATWHIRKQEALDALASADDIGVKMVCLCDKVSNLRSINMNLLAGNKVWENFHQSDPAEHYWYYASIRDLLKELNDSPVYAEYCFLIHNVFRDLEG